jgi:hypothetical protein
MHLEEEKTAGFTSVLSSPLQYKNNRTKLTDKFGHDLTEVQLPDSVLGSGLLGPGLENRGIELTHLALAVVILQEQEIKIKLARL